MTHLHLLNEHSIYTVNLKKDPMVTKFSQFLISSLSISHQSCQHYIQIHNEQEGCFVTSPAPTPSAIS